MEKIKTALLSYGMSGKIFHAPFLELHDGFELSGAWERSKKNIQQDYPNVKSYDTFDELLNDDISLVVVNTPVATHYEFTKKAVEAGKHVLVEKAFTTNAGEAEELMNLARKKGVTLTVYQNRRWDSDFLTVKKVLEQGVLGEIIEAEIHFDRYNPELSPKAHKETGEPGAGVLWDLGSHVLDQALQLFGFPQAVFGDIRNTREGSKIGDWFDILLYYPKNRVRVKAGFFVKEPLPAYILHGTKGSFVKSRADVQEDKLKEGTKPNATVWCSEPEDKQGLLHTANDKIHVPTENGNYYQLFDGVYNAIANGAQEPVTAAQGVQVMKVIDAAQKSSQLKQVVQV